MKNRDSTAGRTNARTSIPLFKLDEFARDSERDLPVIEDLETAFNQVEQDVFSPHRHDYYEVFIVLEGQTTVRVDRGEYRITTPSVCLFPPGTVHAWDHDPHLTGRLLRVPASILHFGSNSLDGIQPQPLGYEAKIMPLSGEVMSRIDAVSLWLYRESKTLDVGAPDILRAQLQLLFLELARALQPLGTETGGLTDGTLAGRFRQLVEAHYQDSWAVSDYAVQLRVGRARLGRAVRDVFGSTPAQMASDRLMMEAKRMVAFSDLRLGQIADELGYPSQAYFCRVFRAATGLPPSDFRLQAERDKNRDH